MRYYLIIGYQVIDKNKDFPEVRVSIDNNFITQFICDNEYSIQIKTTEKHYKSITNKSTAYELNSTTDITYEFRSPKKYKILEIEIDQLQNNSNLRIEITNNKSNYNNGFITKKSLVSIEPVYLINKDLLHNKKAMHRLMKYEYWADSKVVANARHDWHWPGSGRYNKSILMPLNDINYCRGGDFTMEFDIVKKHNTHILVVDKIKPRGIFCIPAYFRAWYTNYMNEKILLQTHTDHDVNLPGDVRQPGLSGTAHIVVTKDDQNK